MRLAPGWRAARPRWSPQPTGRRLRPERPRPAAFGPAQFHSAYNLPTTAPNAQTIAIVDAFDDPNIESDLANYSSYYGLPPCTTANGCFKKVNQTGGTLPPIRTRAGRSRSPSTSRRHTPSARTARSCSSRPPRRPPRTSMRPRTRPSSSARPRSRTPGSRASTRTRRPTMSTSTIRASPSRRRRATTATASGIRQRRAT